MDLSKYVTDSKKNYKPGKIDRMLIISRPGIGKTNALMQLPNSVMFDLENSSAHYKGDTTVINIKEVMEKEKWGPVTTLKHMTDYVKTTGKYRFCIIDTISVIDDWAEALALVNYKETPMGKTSQVKHIFDLPMGAGYAYHRNAFQEIIEWFEGIAETLILVAHVKDSSIKKSNGDNTSVIDIRLTGALREIISAKQDASCIMNFDKEEPNKRYLDFRKSEENAFMKCRVEHLSGKMILISEKMEDGTLKTYWKDVFLDL